MTTLFAAPTTTTTHAVGPDPRWAMCGIPVPDSVDGIEGEQPTCVTCRNRLIVAQGIPRVDVPAEIVAAVERVRFRQHLRVNPHMVSMPGGGGVGRDIEEQVSAVILWLQANPEQAAVLLAPRPL